MGLSFRVVTDYEKDLIRVDFQRKVGSIGFTLQEAVTFRKLWDMHIEALQKKQLGGNDGRRNQ